MKWKNWERRWEIGEEGVGVGEKKNEGKWERKGEKERGKVRRKK